MPFFTRAGKALAARATEVRVIFRRPPRLAFLDEPHHPDPNHLVFRIDPDPGLRLALLSKGPDGRASRDVHMDLPFAAELGTPPGPYERLLHDALAGDRSLFTREDAVEETWRVLQPAGGPTRRHRSGIRRGRGARRRQTTSSGVIRPGSRRGFRSRRKAAADRAGAHLAAVPEAATDLPEQRRRNR